MGNRWRRCADVFIALYAFGTAISFFLIVEEQLHRLASAVMPAGEWETNKKLMLVTVTVLIVYPLSLLRDLRMLRQGGNLE